MGLVQNKTQQLVSKCFFFFPCRMKLEAFLVFLCIYLAREFGTVQSKWRENSNSLTAQAPSMDKSVNKSIKLSTSGRPHLWRNFLNLKSPQFRLARKRALTKLRDIAGATAEHHLCEMVCQYCISVTGRAVSSLCHSHCEDAGWAFEICYTLWFNKGVF